MRPYRTLLEQKIRERRMTLEEFCAYAETFAREHGEPGTLSLRHLQRLVAGKGPKGQPLGPIRPATARLLERIFEVDSSKLLAPPMRAIAPPGDEAADLRERIQKSRRVDVGMLQGLRGQLNTIRRIDRQYGAIATHNELLTRISQIHVLFAYSFVGSARRELAVLLSEMHALAGWQSLDMGRASASWSHYEKAKSIALESEDSSYYAHAAAEQGFTLIDLGETAMAAELIGSIRHSTKRSFSPLLESWLAAAHGEVLASDGQHEESMRSFDVAERGLPYRGSEARGPYVVLDVNHLARWRGHATSQTCCPWAIDLVQRSIEVLDPTFVRAESALRVDFATALMRLGRNEEALCQIRCAEKIAARIGSSRQARRARLVSNVMHGWSYSSLMS